MQRLKWLLLAGIVGASMALAVPASATHSQFHPDCSDLQDNDGDGLVDYPADPGCTSADDQDETDPPPTGTKPKCNSGRGNGSEINPVTGRDCDPGNSGGKNNGGD